MPTNKILKVVFDCNIIWQAFFFSNGASAKCKRFVEDDKVELYLSSEVLEEMRDVLTRSEVQAAYQSTPEAVEKYLENLAQKSVLIRSVAKKFAYPRDPDDEAYINLAVAARADYLVTRDKDLLDLMSDYTPEAKTFRQRFRPLKVLDPVDFLKIIESATV